jgi:hypothetical protein
MNCAAGFKLGTFPYERYMPHTKNLLFRLTGLGFGNAGMTIPTHETPIGMMPVSTVVDIYLIKRLAFYTAAVYHVECYREKSMHWAICAYHQLQIN